MKTKLATLMLSLAFFGSAHADVKTLEQNLKTNYPDLPIKGVYQSPVQGIYEVYTSGRIVYTNQDAKYFFVGNLVDIKQQKNMTEERIAELGKIDVKSLPLNQAIKYVKGTGERTLYVFSDPDCPYCQRLEQNMVGVDNVTVYVFLYPLTSLHPNAEKVSNQIWCAKNPAEAWTNYMLNRKLPTNSKSCSSPIQKNIALGQKLNIDGTPTLFLQDGQRISGVPSDAKQIEDRINFGDALEHLLRDFHRRDIARAVQLQQACCRQGEQIMGHHMFSSVG